MAPAGVCAPSAQFPHGQYAGTYCQPALESFFNSSFKILAIVAGVLAGVQLFGVLMASCLMCAIGAARRRDREEDRLINSHEAHRIPYSAPGTGYVPQARGPSYQTRY